MSHVIQEQVQVLVDKIVSASVEHDYKDAMLPFKGRLSPEMEHMIKVVFEAGVRCGASAMLVEIIERGPVK